MTGSSPVEGQGTIRLPGGTLDEVLGPVRWRRTSELIADRIVTAIALGHYVPGQRLPTERELAEMLKVSRATVHDALQQVEGVGSVEVRRGRNGGAYVTSGWAPGSAQVVERTLAASWHELEALFDFRQFIEPLIAGAAAERHTDEDLPVLEAALEEYRRAGKDREASRAADQRLHLAIATATHNPYLVSVSVQIRDQVGLGFDAEPYTPAVRRRALAQHAALVEAIAERRPVAATETAREHFALTEAAIRALLLRAQSPAGNGRSAVCDSERSEWTDPP